MATIAILGGGVSGLSCAYYLRTLGKSKVKYLFLLEKSPKFGGWIQTTRYPDGAIFEHGPRTLRISGKPGYNALALAEELGLGPQVLPLVNPSVRKRFILVRKELHELPNSLRYLFRAVPPFSQHLLGSVMKDFRTPKSSLPDESIYDYAERRLGTEVAQYIFDPLCRGICANDAKETSVRMVLPYVFELEKQYGSLIKGFIRDQRKKPDVSDFSHSFLARNAHKNLWRIWTLRDGLSGLINALACSIEESGNADLHVNAECTHLKFIDGKALVRVDDEDIEVDHVFSSIPSMQLASLLLQYSNLTQHLTSISFVTVAVVYLEYSGFAVKREGFGFLTPSTEDAKVLGIVFDSCCIPEQNGVSRSRITCMMGGKWFTDIFGSIDTVTEEQILNIAVDEAKKHLNIKESPVRTKVVLQKQCIPHYAVGHYKKVEDMKSEIKNNNLCLSLIGASYEAVGVPSCIYDARIAVGDYLKALP